MVVHHQTSMAMVVAGMCACGGVIVNGWWDNV